MVNTVTKLKGKGITKILILFISLAAITCFNIFQGSNIYSVFLYLAGSLFYTIYLKINSFDPHYSSDYIQNGEGGAGLLIIILVLRFFTGNIYLIFLFTFLILQFYDRFIKKIVLIKNEVITIGTSINLIVLLIILFLISKDKNFQSTLISNTILGYAHNLEITAVHISILFLICFLFIIMITKLKHELKLFSHGFNYFNISNLNYQNLSLITSLMRSLIFSFLFLLIGFTGGIGYYIISRKMKLINEIESLLIITVYIQVFVLLNQFLNQYTIALISVLLSYFFYFLFNKKRIYLYDRN